MNFNTLSILYINIFEWIELLVCIHNDIPLFVLLVGLHNAVVSSYKSLLNGLLCEHFALRYSTTQHG